MVGRPASAMLRCARAGKNGTHQARRLVAARLHTSGPKTKTRLDKAASKKWRANEDVLRILFEDIAPAMKSRNGGYTRIIHLGQRQGDASQSAIIEWVDYVAAAAPEAPAVETKAADEKK